jgi:hypothetical protein
MPPPDGFVWFLLACVALAGGCFGGGAVLAWQQLRTAPARLVPAAGVLCALSLLVVVPHAVDAGRAAGFLAQADSVRGVVRPQYARGGELLVVDYRSDSTSRRVVDRQRAATAEASVGDSVWVYYDPEAPSSATIGRPGPEWRGVARQLGVLWIVGGVLVMGYGLSATPSGVPPAWRPAVRLFRAYLGAVFAASVGVAVVILLQSPPDTPRDTVSEGFWSGFGLAALPSLTLTPVCGTIASLVLQARGWTGAFAYAVCGALFGAVAAFATGGMWLLHIGGVAGVLAALTFRGLYYSQDQPRDDTGTAV